MPKTTLKESGRGQDLNPSSESRAYVLMDAMLCIMMSRHENYDLMNVETMALIMFNTVNPSVLKLIQNPGWGTKILS